jgi:hypothetical protein
LRARDGSGERDEEKEASPRAKNMRHNVEGEEWMVNTVYYD